MASKDDKNEKNVPGRFYVDNNCISCGLCCDTAPECFKMDEEENIALVFKQPNDDSEIESCEEAMDSCPVSAIGDDGE